MGSDFIIVKVNSCQRNDFPTNQIKENSKARHGGHDFYHSEFFSYSVYQWTSNKIQITIGRRLELELHLNDHLSKIKNK